MKSLWVVCSFLMSVDRVGGATVAHSAEHEALYKKLTKEEIPKLMEAFKAAKEWGASTYAPKQEPGVLANSINNLNVEQYFGDDRDGSKAYYYIMNIGKMLNFDAYHNIVACSLPGFLEDEPVKELSCLRNADIAGEIWNWALDANRLESGSIFTLATFMTLMFRNMEKLVPVKTTNTDRAPNKWKSKTDRAPDKWEYTKNKPGYFGVTGITSAHSSCISCYCSKQYPENLHKLVISNFCSKATIYAEFRFFNIVCKTIVHYFGFAKNYHSSLFPLLAFYDSRILDLAKGSTTALLLAGYAHVHLQTTRLLFKGRLNSNCTCVLQ